MNLPNTITLGRIFLVPLLVVVLLTNPKELQLFGLSKEILGALIFALASVTDWLDGYLARRRRQVTGLGQWMDPLADKLLVISALVSLLYLEVAPAWMVFVIIGREFYVTFLRAMLHSRGQSLPASPLGKVKLISQVAAILILILGRGHLSWFFEVGRIALWVATITALISAVDYSRRINAMLSAPSSAKASAGDRSAAPDVQPRAAASAQAPTRGRISA